MALRYKKMLASCGIDSGRVALYGNFEIGQGLALINGLHELIPEIEFIGYYDDPILSEAMLTKDIEEVERLKAIGKTCAEIMELTVDYLRNHNTNSKKQLINSNGQLLKIKDVKRKINLWLAERDCEIPQGYIFSIGKDAGIPHHEGDPESILSLGMPIVFDFFPCEAGGGVYFDITRTWCLGFASDEVKQIYQDVLETQLELINQLEVGKDYNDFQKLACESFEGKGHPIITNNPSLTSGYVHTIGHGVGLRLHERPFVGKNGDKLKQGMVFTIEPGLYYPEKGIGVRIEDTVYLGENGLEILADFPKDLIIEMKS
ncbi:MAG: aminopeptidase P family protein [Anaerolineaceae bacterium]|nr:aminopeptidase P family protein [Anaerolineaceae bacterium]